MINFQGLGVNFNNRNASTSNMPHMKYFFLLERLFPNPWDHLMWKVAVSTYSQGHGKNAPAQGNRLVMQR